MMAQRLNERSWQQRLAGWPGLAALGLAVCLIPAGCGKPGKPPPLVFYPPLPARPRIQFLRQLNTSDDVEPPPGGFQRLVFGEDARRKLRVVARPYGLALWEDKLYVCDTAAQRAVVFDFKQRQFRTFGDQGMQRLLSPINISVGPNGEKYICDTLVGKVFVFDRSEKLLRTISREEGMKPCDAIWHEGELFVADLRTHSILVFDPSSGRLLRQFGKRGKGPGEFFYPTNLAFGPKGYLFVSDTMNARVQKLDKSGKSIKVFGGRGLALGKMIRPKGIAVDRAGRLYVADAAPQTVQIYDSEGRLLLMLGVVGPGGPDPGVTTLPAKVIVSYDGIEHFARYASPDFQIEHLIFVSNQFSRKKITVYGFGTYTGTVAGEQDGGPGAAAVPEGRASAAPASEREKKAGAPPPRSGQKK